MSWKYVQRDEDGKYRTTSSGGGGGGASALTDLEDVNVSSPSDGQMLKYNGTSSKWENVSASSGHTYSTTEQVVGTWIDGKPLYEKVLIQDSGISTGDVEIPHGINNLDEIIFVVGNGCLADGKKILLPLTSRNGNNYNIGITEYDSSSVWVEVGVSYVGVYAIDLIKIIIRYTKTTD